MNSLLDMNPEVLVSIINQKLRDYYSSLQDLCEDLDIVEDMLVLKLNTAGFHYDVVQNQFK